MSNAYRFSNNIHALASSQISTSSGSSHLSDDDLEGDSLDSSGMSTSDSPSSTTAKTGQGKELAAKETVYVNRLRYLVLIIMVLISVGVSCTVYFLLDSTKKVALEEDYGSIKGRLNKVFKAIRNDRIAALSNLALSATSHGLDSNGEWPFVTLSSFQQRTHVIMKESFALQVSIANYVTEDVRLDYEEYIVSNASHVDWMEDAMAYHHRLGIHVDHGESFTDEPLHSIKQWDGNTTDAGTTPLPYQPVSGLVASKQEYLPIWETSPFLRFNDVNIDILKESYGSESLTSIKEGAIVMSDMVFAPSGGMDSTDRATSTFAQLLSLFDGTKKEYNGEPMSYIFLPIYDSHGDDLRQAKAVLVGVFDWKRFFYKELPPKYYGIDLVLHNTCNSSVTYRLAKSGITFTGIGVS
ncbi:MAG: hypothetical protein SGARI_000020 [Bacillariaceae sp.]